jgi:hypothetical protein
LLGNSRFDESLSFIGLLEVDARLMPGNIAPSSKAEGLLEPEKDLAVGFTLRGERRGVAGVVGGVDPATELEGTGVATRIVSGSTWKRWKEGEPGMEGVRESMLNGLSLPLSPCKEDDIFKE